MPARSRPESVYQLKLTLRNVRPPIWRRLQVSNLISLHDLHIIIQVAMGWDGYHLHCFSRGCEELSSESEDAFEADPKEARTLLRSVLRKEGEKLRYDYDFGDGWEHDILLEKVLPVDPSVKLPRCLTGKRACPPEDCGGPWRYAYILETLANPAHLDHEEMKEWMEDDFDPERFGVADTNRQLNPIAHQ